SDPARQVGGRVGERSVSLDCSDRAQHGGAHLGNEFFPAVLVGAEVIDASNAGPVEPRGVAGRMGQLMKLGRPALSLRVERVNGRKVNRVASGLVVGTVRAVMRQ